MDNIDVDESLEPSFNEPGIREPLQDLPPSSKFIAKVLIDKPWLTRKQISQQTLLPKETVRYGLHKLESVDLVATRHSLENPGIRMYAINKLSSKE